MTTPKFTPGPWIVIGGGDLTVRSANRRDTGKFTHLDIAERIGGLRRGPDFKDRSEAEANANLIAAAPCMADYIFRKASEGCSEAALLVEKINGHT